RGSAGKGQNLRRALSQDQAARTAQPGARASRGGANGGIGGLGRTPDAERRASQPGARRWSDGILGMGSPQRPLRLGRRAIPDFRGRSRELRSHRRQYQGADPPRGLEAPAERDQAGGGQHAELSERVSRLSSERRAALVHRNGGGQRRRHRQYRAHQRRDRRHHRPQGSRRAPGAVGARGRPSRAQRLGARAIDRAPGPPRPHQGLHPPRRLADRHSAAVDGRIGALARPHTLLAPSRWQGADLARLVDEELAPYRADAPERITAAGPDVSLEPRTAQTLALALHELSTNAAKYGSLS